MTNQDEKIISEIAGHYREILKLIGENPDREGLQKTPLRAAKAIYDITAGYRQNPDKIATQAIFEHDGSRIVIVKDIEFYSMCEHHILPFFGKIAVGYIPKGKMIGLSKLARIVDCYARRLQVQERLTSQICKLLTTSLPNEGVIVACEAGHLCMKMRGVEKQESTTVTFDYSGKFVEDYNIRSEFLSLIKS
ncbi:MULTISPECIES: GTP cyclohydrolase I FolE [Bacteroidales]|jgi:GTP cyclohydrolase I|uniref:GTP cyclohydrolase I FolE n=1 Tax=Lepagella muris TaxID=3032870 RepID=A0AC61RCH2_9BACT|nr:MULTISPECIES: GTP cyclohydrolase I FolE [Bacteroidales]ROT03764.1 GTP cyclohydrolase I FolE [Muribaculaceae bacterium Isolate-037 (Harlan)]TGY75714.1 GTP cyclohydrolase I FolE [Lepagella muris]THG45843.1 GTP cyclohydrolase I FolE [Bacteroidales bacterium]TKC54160.1 GTP cyclohydrolase I FolE [Bacteroidales bacterium]